MKSMKEYMDRSLFVSFALRLRSGNKRLFLLDLNKRFMAKVPVDYFCIKPDNPTLIFNYVMSQMFKYNS